MHNLPKGFFYGRSLMEPTVPSLVISANTPPQAFSFKGSLKFDPCSLPNPRLQPRSAMPTTESQRFHAKKDVSSSHRTPPPTPVATRYAGVPRLAGKARTEVKAKRVSFRPEPNDRGLRSPFYNPEKLEPFLTQCYDCLSKIGMGSFSEVFMARSKEDGKFYAVKRLNQFASQPDRRRKLDEVKKCQMVSPHQNLVRFYDAWEEKNRLYIMTELCEMSMRDLTEKIHSISEPVIWNYLYDLLQALKHLHDNNMVHLDVKPANIFLSKEGTCKLGDFGLLLDLSVLGDKISFEDVEEGDGCYLAPEVLSNNIITKAADIFSLGITMLEVATDLELPAHGDEWKELREGVFPEEFMSKLSPELLHVIQWMMHPDWQQRPTVDQLLALPQIAAVPMRRQSLVAGDEPQRQLIGAALRASTPLGVPAASTSAFTTSLSGAQVPFSSVNNDKGANYDDTSSVPVADALNFEFGRNDEDHEERACTPTGTPRMFADSPHSAASSASSWIQQPSSLNLSQDDDGDNDAVMASDEDSSFATNSSTSRINSAFSHNRNRAEKLSPFVVPPWALDRSDRAILEAPNTAPPAVFDVRSVTPDLLSSSPLMGRLETSTSRSQIHGGVRRPSPVALCEIFEQLPSGEQAACSSSLRDMSQDEEKRP